MISITCELLWRGIGHADTAGMTDYYAVTAGKTYLSHLTPEAAHAALNEHDDDRAEMSDCRCGLCDPACFSVVRIDTDANAVLVEHVTLETAIEARAAKFDTATEAAIIDERDGFLACISGLSLGCGCPRCERVKLNEDAVSDAMFDLARCADKSAPALAMLLRVIAEEPAEVAIGHAPDLVLLADRLHPDTYGPSVARAAARVLTMCADACAEDEGSPNDTRWASDL